MNYGNYGERIDYSEMETEVAEEAKLEHRGQRGDRRIIPSLHSPATPLHRKWMAPSKRARARATLGSLNFAARTALSKARKAL